MSSQLHLLLNPTIRFLLKSVFLMVTFQLLMVKCGVFHGYHDGQVFFKSSFSINQSKISHATSPNTRNSHGSKESPWFHQYIPMFFHGKSHVFNGKIVRKIALTKCTDSAALWASAVPDRGSGHLGSENHG